jgi:hypothetical protein
MFYWFLYVLNAVLQYSLAWLGYDTRSTWTSDTVAFYGSLAVAVLAAMALPEILLRTMATSLYPDAAGVPPRLYRYPPQTRTRWIAVSMVVLFVAIFLGLLSMFIPGPLFRVPYSVFLFATVVISAFLWSWRLGAVIDKEDPVLGTARLFESLGFKVELAVTTGDPTLDPLLFELDLIAWRRPLALAVRLEVQKRRIFGSTDTPMPPVALAATGMMVVAAASAARRILPVGVEWVAPLLVLVDREADSTLEELASKEQLVIWSVPGRVLENARWCGEGAPSLVGTAHEYGLTQIVSDAGENPDPRWRRTEGQSRDRA